MTARFYLDHYFDNFDFSEPRLINTPVFNNRIDGFLDTISGLENIPLRNEIDRLIALTAISKETQKYLVWHLISRLDMYYFRPQYDAAYIHVVNDYLLTDKVAWVYPILKGREMTEVKKLQSLVNGNTGADLEMPDSSGVFHSLYNCKSKYTILLFWASTCSHCREEMPSIEKFYEDFHKSHDLEIFAVSTDTSTVRWKNYIRRHKLPCMNVFGRKGINCNYHTSYNVQITPTLFLLDEKKRIIAKYLKPEKFGELIKKMDAEEKQKK